jgi:hypothetical protein
MFRSTLSRLGVLRLALLCPRWASWHGARSGWLAGKPTTTHIIGWFESVNEDRREQFGVQARPTARTEALVRLGFLAGEGEVEEDEDGLGGGRRAGCC